MKTLREITKTVENEEEMRQFLAKLSAAYGGAWIADVEPFSHITHFLQFPSPSKVPDCYLDRTQNTLAYRGRLRQFTAAAQRREYQRGFSAD